jgi:prepilin-type N-terminal cleavage/methylation domain-containing protein
MKKEILKNKTVGFTLIELLIVIGIIAVLAAFAFVALNPLARFQDSRNAKRWTDVNTILAAVKLHQVDNKGAYLDDITALEAGSYYQIGAGESNIACDNPEYLIEPNCISLEPLVTAGYLASVPFDPNATGASATNSHYFLMRDSRGFITVGACDEELGSNTAIPEISVTK